MSSFKSAYVWPSDCFPFRVYFSCEKVRIFIIENIAHNWEWLSLCAPRFKPTDVFFVYCGWNHSKWFADQAVKSIEALQLDRDSFFYLFNSSAEVDNFSGTGFKGELINQNAWLDENLVMKPLQCDRLYDAIYVGRRSDFKRHMLANKVPNLAVVAGNNHGKDISSIPATSYLNETPLSPNQVCEKINQSHCGLILSEEEGACFASSEYLLCGIPVVSTHSKGGRDVWYDEYNSIVCDPDPIQIADAVAYFKAHPRDPEVIRANHIEQARKHRLRFINVFEQVLHQHGVRGLDVHRYFYDNYFHKMRESIKPDFDAIFPPMS
jgi:glycosyltransferase involved in cell wall biosynthesis